MDERRDWKGRERRNREELDRLWDEFKRLEAILVGEGLEQKGGLRAEVLEIKAGNRANRWLLRATLGALLTEVILKILKLI